MADLLVYHATLALAFPLWHTLHL